MKKLTERLAALERVVSSQDKTHTADQRAVSQLRGKVCALQEQLQQHEDEASRRRESGEAKMAHAEVPRATAAKAVQPSAELHAAVADSDSVTQPAPLATAAASGVAVTNPADASTNALWRRLAVVIVCMLVVLVGLFTLFVMGTPGCFCIDPSLHRLPRHNLPT